MGTDSKERCVCGIDEEEFERFTRYCCLSDNREDNLRRARLLGFGDDVQIAPGDRSGQFHRALLLFERRRPDRSKRAHRAALLAPGREPSVRS